MSTVANAIARIVVLFIPVTLLLIRRKGYGGCRRALERGRKEMVGNSVVRAEERAVMGRPNLRGLRAKAADRMTAAVAGPSRLRRRRVALMGALRRALPTAPRLPRRDSVTNLGARFRAIFLDRLAWPRRARQRRKQIATIRSWRPLRRKGVGDRHLPIVSRRRNRRRSRRRRQPLRSPRPLDYCRRGRPVVVSLRRTQILRAVLT